MFGVASIEIYETQLRDKTDLLASQTREMEACNAKLAMVGEELEKEKSCSKISKIDRRCL